MAIRMTKPWLDLTPENVKRLTGQLGVFQLADASGKIVAIGFAGGRSLFGLRGEVERAMRERPADAAKFRVEVNQQYTTRYQELLMVHVADHGSLPAINQLDPPPRLGRMSPL
jgi:hypothetical protein